VFLGASRVSLNFINRSVNTELDTRDGEELIALHGSFFSGFILLLSILFDEDV
jgi:uncharacterized membrane protein YdcZ (DUF606 family)